jgi:hypothetical protein
MGRRIRGRIGSEILVAAVLKRNATRKTSLWILAATGLRNEADWVLDWVT